MFCPSSARDLEFFWKTILLSSFARGSKPIFDTSILLRPRFEADRLIYWFAHLTGLTLDCQTCSISVLHLKPNQTWFCFGLTLENQSNLVLFWSYTWKPIKLGSVPVLHLKASQTWFCSGLTLENQSNLVLFRSYTWKLKASQTCNSNFVICFLTWTYPSLPV